MEATCSTATDSAESPAVTLSPDGTDLSRASILGHSKACVTCAVGVTAVGTHVKRRKIKTFEGLLQKSPGSALVYAGTECEANSYWYFANDSVCFKTSATPIDTSSELHARASTF